MSGGHAELLARRERLIARAAEQRDDIARSVGEIQAVVDRGRTWLGALKRVAPVVGIGLGIGALVLGRSRLSVGRVLKSGLAIWKFTRALR